MGAVVAISAATSAFTLAPVKKAPDNKLVSLYWFSGTTYTGRQNTHAAEVPLSPCPDTGTRHCEDGYDANDFNTMGDPTSGLKPGATINDFIKEP